MSDIVIAVECSIRSGTRITTRLALEYGKDVGAVPHPIFSPQSEGTNELLNNGANCIRNSNDILNILGYDVNKFSIQDIYSLTVYEKLIYNVISTRPHTRYELQRKTKIPLNKLQHSLASLSMKSLIIERLGYIAKRN